MIIPDAVTTEAIAVTPGETIETIPGRDVRVGDVLVLIGGRDIVTEIEPYDGPMAAALYGGEARIARLAIRGGITLCPLDRVDVVRPGGAA